MRRSLFRTSLHQIILSTANVIELLRVGLHLHSLSSLFFPFFFPPHPISLIGLPFTAIRNLIQFIEQTPLQWNRFSYEPRLTADERNRLSNEPRLTAVERRRNKIERFSNADERRRNKKERFRNADERRSNKKERFRDADERNRNKMDLLKTKRFCIKWKTLTSCQSERFKKLGYWVYCTT